MLHLHTWHTPNGKKVPILLAELDWSYALHLVDLGKKEQKSPAYLAINPNGKIPALVDREDGGEPIVIFESGAILEYVADKAGRFLPKDARRRAETMSWVYWQVGGPGPFFGQLLSFGREAPRDDHAYAKFLEEAKRLVSVLEGRLRDREWIAGEYSIADIASYPWFAALAERDPAPLAEANAVKRWLERMGARPAVKLGMELRPPRATAA